MEDLQARLDALEIERQEILKKMKAATPATQGDLNALKEELKQEILAAIPKSDPCAVDHTTAYLASGLGMTTIDPLPGKENAKTEYGLGHFSLLSETKTSRCPENQML